MYFGVVLVVVECVCVCIQQFQALMASLISSLFFDEVEKFFYFWWKTELNNFSNLPDNRIIGSCETR